MMDKHHRKTTGSGTFTVRVNHELVALHKQRKAQLFQMVPTEVRVVSHP